MVFVLLSRNRLGRPSIDLLMYLLPNASERENEADRQRRLAAKKEKEEKEEAERKHRQFRDGVFERHRSSSRSASDSSRRAKRAQFKSQATAEGFVTMIDGYNAAIIDFNEKAQAISEREAELERIEFETPA